MADRDDGFAVDLRPGRPDLSSFPRTDWATSVRRALAAAPYEDLDYAGPAGLPVLRAAVADYVTRARGVRADAAAVVITAGFTPGLALLARVLRRLGTRTVATSGTPLPRRTRGPVRWRRWQKWYRELAEVVQGI